MAGTWTEDRVKKLQALIAAGECSASEIGRRLGVNRSQVLGKCHRLGLSITGGTAARKSLWASHKAKNIHKARKQQKITQYAPPVILAPIPERQAGDIGRKQLADLESGDCKFPVGDPGTPGFGFCASGRVEGLPYCAEHAARCFVVPNNLKSRGKDTSRTRLDASADASDLVSAGE